MQVVGAVLQGTHPSNHLGRASAARVVALSRQAAEAVQMAESFRRSIAALADHALLSAEEERAHSDMIRLGAEAEQRLADGESGSSLISIVSRGRQARNTLVEQNQRLVIAQAYKFLNSGLDMVDLIQEGNLGLIRAAEKFDGRKGFRFATYAKSWISVYMTRFSSERRQAIRIPLEVYANLNKMNVAREGLIGETGGNPTVDEVASRSGLRCEQVVQAMRLVRVIALDGARSENDFSLMDVLPDENATDPVEAALAADVVESLHRGVRSLPPEQSAVVTLKYGLGREEPMNLKNIANLLGVSASRASVLHRTALGALAMITEDGSMCLDADRADARDGADCDSNSILSEESQKERSA